MEGQLSLETLSAIDGSQKQLNNHQRKRLMLAVVVDSDLENFSSTRNLARHLMFDHQLVPNLN